MSEKTHTFKAVMREYFISKNADYSRYEMDKMIGLQEKDDDIEDEIDAKLYNFYIERQKEWKVILHDLDIDEEAKYIKDSSNNYVFDDECKAFIIRVFSEFSGKMEPIRRGQIGAADYEFRIELFEGFYKIFKDSQAPDEVVERAINKIYNRLDIPVCMLEAVCTTNSERLREMVDDNIHTAHLGMNTELKYTWLTAFAEDYRKFVRKWSDLFCYMKDIRNEEISDRAARDSENMPPELEEYANYVFAFAEEINDARELDEEYQNLSKRYCKIMGQPYHGPILSKDVGKDIKNIMKRSREYKKRPFVDKVEKEYYEIRVELYKKARQIEQDVIRRHVPGYVLPEEDETDDNYEYKAADEVLKEAIEYQKDCWESDLEMAKRAKVELPDIDFEELRKHIKPFTE